MNKKGKLNIDEQIEHMKNKGIVFNIIDETLAKKILSHKTYYFKLKSYAKIYPKTQSDKYDKLEFSYIYEISKIDMAFRNFLLKITLDTEHLVKTLFLYKISQAENDGYELVDSFLKSEEGLNTKILLKKYKEKITQGKSGGLYDILKHYSDEIPIWVFVEILTFNDFIKFYTFCIKSNESFSIYKTFSNWTFESIRWLRNLSAHNNSILIRIDNTVNEKRKYLLKKISPYRKNITTKENTYTLEEMLQNALIVDFLEVINLFSEICKNIKKKNYIAREYENFVNYALSKQAVNSNIKLKNFIIFTQKSLKVLLRN
ncbi:Abi family protein [Campylobacter sp. CNRCH_2016_0050h]|uniref:Abi family protein n=1 Tax=Campylobacter sp. CNRCH_2016_0050h TaxID=2911608 RepID=UPI0021E67A4F|nr:Abi family protein [Campylobacter sp. CNRCH_2016_0050h]MCV3457096.1 Abi family protein [Campylobacter sp. CNRCH_2016_0050h]